MNKEGPKPDTKKPYRGCCTRKGIRTGAAVVVAGILRDRRVMDEEAINRARLRAQVWRENRHLFNRNEGVGELRQLSEEELQERDEAVAMQMEGLAPSLNYATRIAAYRAELMRREVVLQRERMEELTTNVVVQIERMEELTANLVRQREQMETLTDNLNRLMRIIVFATVVGALVRRLRP
jgi:hypothetical protein